MEELINKYGFIYTDTLDGYFLYNKPGWELKITLSQFELYQVGMNTYSYILTDLKNLEKHLRRTQNKKANHI